MPLIAVAEQAASRSSAVPRWTQHRHDLQRIADLLRAGLPIDRAFDDVEAVFGDGTNPVEDDIPLLIGRFCGTAETRGHLAVLVEAVTKEEAGVPDLRAQLIARASDAAATVTPSGSPRLAHLRRLALAAQGLLELLLLDDNEEATPCLP
ncbi:hypothetical protein ACIBSR_37980 [Streptomyces sp. NPDC049936]|uniref:hypothetical protein n=1 Tax=Streptomyces sp. NPDC049936 TaxID=3365599 RepID=UPI0037B669E1